MPTYEFRCNECSKTFDSYSQKFRTDNIGDSVTNIPCDSCGKMNAIRVWPEELDITITFGEFRDREDKKEEDHKKRVKCPERAERNRKKHFGSENVSVTKSQYAGRSHKIKKQIVPKASGTSSDIDKTDFIKAAARNPNAVKAAKDALQRAGKKA